eukprot:1137107-Pelagomonas_calceolata.AAC.5
MHECKSLQSASLMPHLMHSYTDFTFTDFIYTEFNLHWPPSTSMILALLASMLPVPAVSGHTTTVLSLAAVQILPLRSVEPPGVKGVIRRASTWNKQAQSSKGSRFELINTNPQACHKHWAQTLQLPQLKLVCTDMLEEVHPRCACWVFVRVES